MDLLFEPIVGAKFIQPVTIKTTDSTKTTDEWATVSIVIVNWKTPDLLARCLDSIKNDPNHNNFDIWVIDNASNDYSVAMLERQYPYVHTITNKQNVGFSRACNQAIPKTRGKFILLLNPDTVLMPGAISILCSFMLNNSKCGAAGPKVLNPDGTIQLACRRAFPSLLASFYRVTYLSRLFPLNPNISRYNFSYADPDKLLEVDALSGACMMVRRQVTDRIGLLDEDIFMFGEDIDWCWRIKQAKWSVFYVPDAIVYHVHGAASRLRPIRATINLHKGMEVFYRKHLAPKYWAPLNALVYSAIWLRAVIFILVNVLCGLFRSNTKSANHSLAASYFKHTAASRSVMCIERKSDN